MVFVSLLLSLSCSCFSFYFFSPLVTSSDFEGSSDENQLCAFWPQLPAVQAGPQKRRPGLRGRNGHREVWVSPRAWEGKRLKGMPGAHGLHLLGRGRGCKGAHIGCERKGPAQGSREDRMERAVWSRAPLPG